MKLIMNSPFKKEISIEIIHHWESILSATRGPDVKTYTIPDYKKALGTSIIRYSIPEWQYGSMFCPEYLKQILCSDEKIETALKEIVESGSHYKSHMADAFDVLQRYFVNIEPLAYKYFYLLEAMWYSAGHHSKDNLLKGLTKLRVFLEKTFPKPEEQPISD